MSTFQFSIPEPCSENWGNMTASEKGRFCKSCSKVVRNLSESSAEEIHALYQEAGGKLCGRIHTSQMAETPMKPITWLKRFALAILLAFGSTLLVFGQSDSSAWLQSARAELLQSKRLVEVRITNASTGEPIPGVALIVKRASEVGKMTASLADENGKATIDLKANSELFDSPGEITIAMEGMGEKTLILDSDSGELNIELDSLSANLDQEGFLSRLILDWRGGWVGNTVPRFDPRDFIWGTIRVEPDPIIYPQYHIQLAPTDEYGNPADNIVGDESTPLDLSKEPEGNNREKPEREILVPEISALLPESNRLRLGRQK